MKKLFRVVLSVLAAQMLLFANTALVVHAAPQKTVGTLVGGDIMIDTIWTKANSPYLITNDVFINGGRTLILEPGTVITNSSSSDHRNTLAIYGSLISKGTEEDPVTIYGLDSVTVSGAKADFQYTQFKQVGMGIHVLNGNVKVASSSFIENGSGIFIMGGSTHVLNSRIERNQNGLFVSSMLRPNSVKIENSIIRDNYEWAIRNDNWVEVQAANNWWGDKNGPSSTSTNKIGRLVSYSPWLTSEPTYEKVTKPCCSNILFLPGMEGTRLYRQEDLLGGLLGTLSNRLWEPNRNLDVKNLFLNEQGTSSDLSVFSGQPIDKALGFVDIYHNFMNFLDSMVQQGTVNEWRSFGYDWRKPINEIVTSRENKGTTTEQLLQVVKDLASRSQTGKISIVAHSNGGLVAKYLAKTLQNMGKENLLDQVISVAVPYLGTPQAAAALLHGDGQSLGKGLLLNQGTARELGRNMPSAYSLLPSSTYFSKIFEPTILFASTTDVRINSGKYPYNITNSSDQNSFIADLERDRRQNGSSDISFPLIGNKDLIGKADVLHSVLDAFVWPKNVMRFGILGWNVATPETLVYFKDKFGKFETNMGDGVVMAKSSAYDVGTTTSLDLKIESETNQRQISHSNILESKGIEEVIRNILIRKDNFCDTISKLPGVKCGEPDYSKRTSFIVLSTHSPVELHIYDSLGRHTGVIPTPPQSGVQDDVITFTEENIPNSAISLSGHDTYITLPDASADYKIEIKGIGVGAFDFEINRELGSKQLAHVEYATLPATPLSIATTTLSLVSSAGSEGDIMKEKSQLSIDIDGNGSADIQLGPNQTIDPISYLDSLKKVIIAILGPEGSVTWIRKIDRLEEMTNKDSMLNAIRAAKRLENSFERMSHKNQGGLNQNEKDKVLGLIESYITMIGKNL